MIEEKTLSNTITKEELQKLEGFIGYGRKDAEVIFFGLEEAGGGYNNLKIRIGIPDYEYLDCKRFHLDNLKYDKLHSDNPETKVKFQPVWRYMSYLMLRLEDRIAKATIKDNSHLLRDYQNNYLGSKSDEGKTLLTEIYPIPCSSLKFWGGNKEEYEAIIPHYKDKDDYKEKVLSKRIALFREIVGSEAFRAKAIICYGKSHWEEFRNFFKELGVKFQKIELSKPSELGLLNGRTKVFLIPFLGNGQMSYDFLDELASKIREV